MVPDVKLLRPITLSDFMILVSSDYVERAALLEHRITQYIDWTVFSQSLALVHSISSWLVWAEIKCVVHDALPKWLKNRFKLVWQSLLRAYCPHIYTY